MSEPLVSPLFLFRFSAPLLKSETLWPLPDGLAAGHTLPALGGLADRPQFATVSGGWNADGLVFTVEVKGKHQTPWCRTGRIDASDGFHLWIDTRDTHNVHRATRFCHYFVFLPAGDGGGQLEPYAGALRINRARGEPNPVAADMLKVSSKVTSTGYTLTAYISRGALTGYDPAEHPRLGFNYLIQDKELGDQPFTLSRDYPMMEDPSLWSSLELIQAE